jgi:hypothetical protein
MKEALGTLAPEGKLYLVSGDDYNHYFSVDGRVVIFLVA